jgi:hypothetical protein
MDDLIAFLNEQMASRKAMAVQAKRALDEWQRGNDCDDRWRLDEDGISINIKGEYVCVGTEVAVFLAFNDPDAVLADVEAKRLLLEGHEPKRMPTEQEPGNPSVWIYGICCAAEEDDEGGYELWPCRHVRLLAMPFADHPDYREEWKP